MNPPDRLRTVVEGWVEDGKPHQPSIPWPRQRWTNAFPEYKKLWSGLPDMLGRADVLTSAEGAADDGGKAVEAFLVAMAWGYGNVGYGRWRVQRCLGTEAAPLKLRTAAERVVARGPIAGYEELAGPCRLAGLGPAFGTKFLYFVSKASTGSIALILDRLVAGWLREHSTLRLNPVPWHSENYGRYLDTLGTWARNLDVAPDEVEQCIFRDVATGQWGRN